MYCSRGVADVMTELGSSGWCCGCLDTEGEGEREVVAAAESEEVEEAEKDEKEEKSEGKAAWSLLVIVMEARKAEGGSRSWSDSEDGTDSCRC